MWVFQVSDWSISCRVSVGKTQEDLNITKGPRSTYKSSIFPYVSLPIYLKLNFILKQNVLLSGY